MYDNYESLPRLDRLSYSQSFDNPRCFIKGVRDLDADMASMKGLAEPRMGIAAGGKLIQDIYTDTNPEYIWDKSRTRLINVHILNSYSFETITQIVPPPTPITARMYIDLGLPVFLLEEKVDARVDGGSPLKDVKSISTIDKQVGIDYSSEAAFDPLRPKRCGTCESRLCDCMYVSPSSVNIRGRWASLALVIMIIILNQRVQYSAVQSPILQCLHQYS